MGPRLRVSVLLRRGGRVLLIRHEKDGREYWLLPGGGVELGESLVDAARRELREEVGLPASFPLEGPIALADSISPPGAPPRHVVHVVFAGDLGHQSLAEAASVDHAVKNHRLFDPGELHGIVLHPPIQRFVARWEPGDPCVYLGSVWTP